MWEVLTRGVEPYPGTTPDQIIKDITSGKRLPKPKQCPQAVYVFFDFLNFISSFLSSSIFHICDVKIQSLLLIICIFF